MQRLSIVLDEWQEAALEALARDRGVEPAQLAQAILGERLRDRRSAVGAHTVRRWRPRLHVPADETIEQRLRRLFDA